MLPWAWRVDLPYREFAGTWDVFALLLLDYLFKT